MNAPDASNILLSTTDLAVGYSSGRNENRLFEHLNLSLTGGQLVCFMGPNGVGKSSLIRTLAGLQRPLAGSVGLSESENKIASQLISVVLTDKISAPGMTVEEVVAFGRYPYLGWSIALQEEDKAIVERSIAQVQIQDLAQQPLQSLSDGQLQMVMIARALAQDTPVVLLDEPTAHLDLNNRVGIMKLLLKIARETRKAILVSTHELDLALQLADWIWLAGADRSMITGIPEDLVLNGSFDSIFRLKGFDLKTGKVEHHPGSEIVIRLSDTGPAYWWTKNALERNGFRVSEAPSSFEVIILRKTDSLKWQLVKNGITSTFNTLSELLNSLDQTIAHR